MDDAKGITSRMVPKRASNNNVSATVIVCYVVEGTAGHLGERYPTKKGKEKTHKEGVVAVLPSEKYPIKENPNALV